MKTNYSAFKTFLVILKIKYNFIEFINEEKSLSLRFSILQFSLINCSVLISNRTLLNTIIWKDLLYEREDKEKKIYKIKKVLLFSIQLQNIEVVNII